jgi:hypothetical protein
VGGAPAVIGVTSSGIVLEMAHARVNAENFEGLRLSAIAAASNHVRN